MDMFSTTDDGLEVLHLPNGEGLMTVKSRNCREEKGNSDEYHKEASDRRSNYSSRGGGVSLILRAEKRVR